MSVRFCTRRFLTKGSLDMARLLHFVKAFFAGALLVFTVGSASADMMFKQAEFDKALASGKPVVVEFHAAWCPTCRAQAPVVKEIMADAAFKQVVFLKADYDKDVDLKKSLNVTKQSTFVVFKGGKEVSRSTGQTSKADLSATFSKAL
jgi:thioredoxin 1